MKRYSEKEIEANKELYYRNQNKDYLKIPTLEDGINGYIDSIGTYNWLMNHYCTQEEFVISKYNTLVGYNGDDKNIVIPDNVERIEKFALRGISYKQTDGADSVYIHKNLNLLSIMESGISTKAFIVDKDNSVFCDIDGILCNKEKDILVKFPCSRKGSLYKIPENIKYIINGAFNNCSMDEIQLNNTMNSISEMAFYSSKIKKMHIPKNIKAIGTNCFFDCNAMEKITFDEGVERIESRAFQVCSALKEIKFPKSLKYIGHYAIADCFRLEKIYIPSSVEKIDGNLFVHSESYKTTPVIYVEMNSYAEKYVKEKGYKFEYYTDDTDLW